MLRGAVRGKGLTHSDGIWIGHTGNLDMVDSIRKLGSNKVNARGPPSHIFREGKGEGGKREVTKHLS